MKNLILLRHGQSVWNLENRFTGWTDVELSELGKQEAWNAGKDIVKSGLHPSYYFTSYLKRAIDTLHIAAKAMDREWIPELKDWHLNERHYGALQGKNKDEISNKFGAEQVKLWRRGFSEMPPLLTTDDSRYPGNDPKYRLLTADELPLAESLQNTISRVRCCWQEVIAPRLQLTDIVLVVAHGNSLRGLAKMLLNLTAEEVVSLEIPTGKPWLFECDDRLRVLSNRYL